MASRKVTKCVLHFALFAISQAAQAQFLFGVGTHIGQNKLNSKDFFVAYEDLGINSFRDEAYWHRIERTKNHLFFPRDLDDLVVSVEGVARRDGRAMIILDYGNKLYPGSEFPSDPHSVEAFLRYVDVVVKRTHQDKVIFELWNEWNIGFGSWVHPRRIAPVAVYVNLAKAVKQRIQEIAPGSQLILGAVAGPDDAWIDEFVSMGGLRWADGFSVHPYMYKGERRNKPEDVFDWLYALDKKIANKIGRPVDLHITEVGWPDYKGPYGASEANVAAYLTRLSLLVRTIPSVKSLYWYELKDSGKDASDKEHRFGLVAQDGRRKPAFEAMRKLAPRLIQAQTASLKNEAGRYTVKLDAKGWECAASWTPVREAGGLFAQWVPDAEVHRRGQEPMPELLCNKR